MMRTNIDHKPELLQALAAMILRGCKVDGYQFDEQERPPPKPTRQPKPQSAPRKRRPKGSAPARWGGHSITRI